MKRRARLRRKTKKTLRRQSSFGCPAAAEIMAATHRAALTTEGIESVHVNLVWSPRWDPKIHASEDAKMDMGIWD